MNSRKSLYDIAEFYRKKAVLNASYQGMRYRVWRKSRTVNEGEGQDCLAVAVWPEPYCYEKTAEELKKEQEFPFEEEGLDQAYEWLCACYEQKKEQWEHARVTGTTGIPG